MIMARGGWSPALFADITGAGFDLLTYRKGPVADLLGPAFTTVACTDDRGRSHEYEPAGTTVALEITEGPCKGEHVTLRQVTRREPASRGAIRQVHTLTTCECRKPCPRHAIRRYSLIKWPTQVRFR